MFWIVKNYWNCWKFLILWYNFEFINMWMRIFGIFSVILLWKINYFWILEIIRIVEKIQNWSIISSLLICEFLKIFWDTFRILMWKIYVIGLLGLLELLKLLGNFGIVAFICIMVVWRNDKNCEKCMKWKNKGKKNKIVMKGKNSCEAN